MHLGYVQKLRNTRVIAWTTVHREYICMGFGKLLHWFSRFKILDKASLRIIGQVGKTGHKAVLGRGTCCGNETSA